MARITTVTADNAEGVIKEGYDMFMKNIGIIPKPMEMMSASPALFETQLQRIKYFSTHPTLSFTLLAHIRYLAAHNLSYSFCVDFNKVVLKKMGLGEKDIQKMEADPSESLLEENEKALLVFVVKSLKAPGSITQEDIDGLRGLGWEDRDMVDALAQGVGMADHALMMEVFQIDQSCLTE